MNMNAKKSVTLKKHINTKHVEEIYECNKCHEKFKGIDNLANHMSTEHDNKVVESSEKQTFGEIDKQALPDITCPLCEDTFLTDQDFNIHINEHLAEIKSMDIEYLKNGHKIFACYLCNFESSDTNLIKKHLARHTQSPKVISKKISKSQYKSLLKSKDWRDAYDDEGNPLYDTTSSEESSDSE